MNQRTRAVAEKIKALRDAVIEFVQNASDADWIKVCEWEQWPVGVTAWHIAAAHFTLFRQAEKLVNGETLPPMTMEQINEAAKKNAAGHLDRTRAEVLELLHQNSSRMIAFVSGLKDEELDRKGHMPAFGGEVSVEQLIQYVIFISAAKHFESMQKAARDDQAPPARK